MKRRKILGIVVLLCVVIACVSLLFLPRDRTIYVLLSSYSRYEGRSGKYLKMSGNVYVNAEDFPDLPELQRGDVLEITHYRSHILHGLRGGTYFDDIVNIKKLYSADWGISLNPIGVSPTGIQLEMKVTRTLSEDLAISAYDLEVCKENQWQPAAILSQDTSLSPISFRDGTAVTLNWASTYGTLESGLYRLSVTVNYEGETREYEKAFSISKPTPTTLEDTVEQSVLHFLTRELLDPPQKTYYGDIERIVQNGEQSIWSEHIAGLNFDQITYSYEIYEHKQEGDLHNYKIFAMCRGYNDQVPASEFGAPIWLTIRQQDATTFDVVSFKMPYAVVWDKVCPRFPTSTRGPIPVLMEFRNKLRAACDAQVVGGIKTPDILGLYYITLDEDSSKANKIFQLIAKGVEVPVPDKFKKEILSKSSMASFTIVIGDRIYYVNEDYNSSADTDFYNLYSVSDDICIKVVGDDYKALKRIVNDPKINLIDDRS